MSGKSRLALGLSLIFFMALAGLFFATKVWMPFMWGLLGPGVLGLFLGLYLSRHSVIEFFTMKSTKQGLNMGALIVIVITLLTLVNYLGAKYYKVFDLSGNGMNTLSDQTKALLSGLDSEMMLRFFYKNGADKVEDNKKQFRDLVKKYQDQSSKVQFEFVEMNEQAKLTQDYGASRGSGEAFLVYKENKNRIENYTEQDLTNAIIKVTRGEKKNIYFIEGHGERNTEIDKDETGMFGLNQLLEKNSYHVGQLSLAAQGGVPADAHAIMIIGPKQNFQPTEVKMLESYLERGGAILLALENRNTAGLNGLLSRLGLELESFYVFNVYNTPMGQVVNAQSPTVAVNYSSTHAATKVFTANQMTVFNQPNAFKLLPLSETVKTEVLVKTPKSSVALKELDSTDYFGEPRVFNLAVEVKGKLSPDDKEFTVIAFSDADFMSNLLLYQNLNRDLALNSVAALVKESDLISISPKEPQATRLILSPPETSQFIKFVVLGLFLPTPLVFMMVSFFLWYRRRHA